MTAFCICFTGTRKIPRVLVPGAIPSIFPSPVASSTPVSSKSRTALQKLTNKRLANELIQSDDVVEDESDFHLALSAIYVDEVSPTVDKSTQARILVSLV